ncbi:MAG: uL30 family ribosomal protein [Candidatus Micrarchaeaceae archaeon]
MALQKNALVAIVRVRGTVGVRKDISETLNRLGLPKTHNLSLVRATDSSIGMITKCSSYIAYGEVSKETLGKLLEHEHVEHSQEAIDALMNGTKEPREVLSMPIRLHPPRHGYKGTRKPYGHGGALGYRGNAIGELINRML